MPTVSSNEARRDFSQLVERAYYKNEAIRVQRNKRDMAWIVGEPYMQRLQHAVKLLIEKDPAYADTLAIEMNPKLQKIIDDAMADIESGRVIPLEDVFKD